MARLTPKFTVIRKILSLSGNRCAFSNCNNPLIFEGAFVGELAHIYAAETNGPRSNIDMTDEQLRDFSNLMYLCGYHHTIIDKKELIDMYPAEILIEMKRSHEERNINQPLNVSDNIIEQALEQINIVQTNFLMNGNQTNIQQNFFNRSVSDASNALSQVIASVKHEDTQEKETSTELNEEGFLDQIAKAETTIPDWTDTINSIALEISKITPIINKGIKSIAISDKINKGLNGRIIVFKKIAKELNPISDRIETLGNNYAEQFKIVDNGVNAILNTVEINIKQAEGYKTFLTNMLDIVESAINGLDPVENMLGQMETIEKLSSDMKKTLYGTRKGLNFMLDSRMRIINWSVRIKKLDT